MATLHPFPRAHCNYAALEQQLAIISLALVERYGTDVAMAMLGNAAQYLQSLERQSAVSNDK